MKMLDWIWSKSEQPKQPKPNPDEFRRKDAKGLLAEKYRFIVQDGVVRIKEGKTGDVKTLAEVEQSIRARIAEYQQAVQGTSSKLGRRLDSDEAGQFIKIDEQLLVELRAEYERQRAAAAKGTGQQDPLEQAA